MNVKKAVIPAAGFGTRFLPITKAQPKEMLPVVDKPVIQYVVEEAVLSELRIFSSSPDEINVPSKITLTAVLNLNRSLNTTQRTPTTNLSHPCRNFRISITSARRSNAVLEMRCSMPNATVTGTRSRSCWETLSAFHPLENLPAHAR